MATKADIVVTAIDKASKVIERVDKGLDSVAHRQVDLTKATKSQLETLHRVIIAQIQQGTSLEELAQVMGLTTEQVQMLAFGIEDLTGKVKDQGIELFRIPKYLMGYRGGWLNLIATLGMGVSIFSLLHRAISQFTDAIGEAIRANRRLTRQIEAGTTIWSAYKRGIGEGVVELSRIGTEAEGALERLSRFHMIIEAIGRAIEETGIPVLREYGVIIKNIGEAFEDTSVKSEELSRQAERLLQYYQELKDQEIDKDFEAQQQAIFEASQSEAEYILKTLDLLRAQGLLSEILQEVSFEVLVQAIALDRAARAAEKFKRWIEALSGVLLAVGGAFDEISDYTSDLGDIQDRYGDRTEDILFRAAQAWEMYTFRVGQAVDALTFRLAQMEAAFTHRIESMMARFDAAATAAAARYALSIETITQDHYDRLEDMAWRHQQELQRLLGQAPWYLQRAIQKYQKRREQLEKKGDKDALRRLDKKFMARMRRLDPHYYQELKRLKKEQKHERDIEDREFQQRLSRASRQYAISRALAEANYEIALADALFAYEQQRKAAEFAHEQRLAAMLFAYLQQKAASGRAYGEALKDQEKALDERQEQFIEEMKSWVDDAYYWGKKAGEAWNEGFGGAGGAGTPPPPPPPPPSPLPSPSPFRSPAGPFHAPTPVGSGGGITVELHGSFYLQGMGDIRALAREISREIGREVAFRR